MGLRGGVWVGGWGWGMSVFGVLPFRVLGFRVQGFGFRVSGFGFRVSGWRATLWSTSQGNTRPTQQSTTRTEYATRIDPTLSSSGGTVKRSSDSRPCACTSTTISKKPNLIAQAPQSATSQTCLNNEQAPQSARSQTERSQTLRRSKRASTRRCGTRGSARFRRRRSAAAMCGRSESNLACVCAGDKGEQRRVCAWGESWRGRETVGLGLGWPRVGVLVRRTQSSSAMHPNPLLTPTPDSRLPTPDSRLSEHAHPVILCATCRSEVTRTKTCRVEGACFRRALG